MYEKFADVYDHLMEDVDYTAWAQYYIDLALHQGVVVRSAADCACGTGNMTTAFFEKGIRITGLDSSSDMLRVAAEKARNKGIRIPFVQQRLQSLALHKPVDAVFCACDGVNYLIEPEEVYRFFTSAYQVLRPGGGLFFDISTYEKLSDCLGNRCIGHDGEDVSYIWQNHFDQSTAMIQMDITFFVKETKGRNYRRFDETHFQRAHTLAEITTWLKEAGFVHSMAFGDQTFAAPAQGEQRVHFAAIRV